MSDGATRTRIVLADDHPLFRAGLSTMLQQHSAFMVVGEASDGSEAVTLARQTRPDVLLLDVAMPVLSGLEVLREISDLVKFVHPIIVTAEISRAQLVCALQLGAQGVLWKHSAATLLAKSIECVMRDEVWISREAVGDVVNTLRAVAVVDPNQIVALPQPSDDHNVFSSTKPRKFRLTLREVEIVNAIIEGQSNHDIAVNFGISEYTVKHHLTRIFDKVGVDSRLELAVFAIHHDLGGPRAN